MNPVEPTAADIRFQRVTELVEAFCRATSENLEKRWSAWNLDLAARAQFEVVGGLLARQTELGQQLALAPSTWNSHIAPVILRAMAEVHIATAWVLCEPQDRAAKFIDYGLGQAKLELEHRRAQLGSSISKDEQDRLSAAESWINSQRFTFLTSVNLGSWSGSSVRKMAEEAKCLDFYDLVYTPFSACAHSSWHHIAHYNLRHCLNPLHQYHLTPVVGDVQLDPHYFYLAAKYIEKTSRTVDGAHGTVESIVDVQLLVSDGLDRILEPESDAT